MLNKEEVRQLAQYIESLEQAANFLETAFIRKDNQGFMQAKALISDLQKKINEAIK